MEIELKFKLNNKKNLINIIKKNKGKFLKSVQENDIYYNVNGRNSIKTKECLRIRQNTEGLSEITYKPGTINLEEKHFAKQETNVKIINPEDAKILLELLGNSVIVAVEKFREYYKLGECVICVDEIKNIGCFVELEIESDQKEAGLTRLYEYAKLLKISNTDIEPRPYRDIVIAHLQK